jgi:hypothetical protein
MQGWYGVAIRYGIDVQDDQEEKALLNSQVVHVVPHILLG